MSKATFPKVIIVFNFFKLEISVSKNLEQLSSSLPRGLSSGGTHFKILVIYVDLSFRPSFKFSEVDWLEIFALCRHLNKNSPDLSPVKALPVLVPPWAAGARPNIKSLALVSPNPDTGLPQ